LRNGDLGLEPETVSLGCAGANGPLTGRAGNDSKGAPSPRRGFCFLHFGRICLISIKALAAAFG
jgi:hypothetical protein